MPTFACSVALRPQNRDSSPLADHRLRLSLTTRPFKESETPTLFPGSLSLERGRRGTAYTVQTNKQTPFSLFTKQAHREASGELFAVSSFKLLLRCPPHGFRSIELSLSQPAACFVSTAFKGGRIGIFTVMLS